MIKNLLVTLAAFLIGIIGTVALFALPVMAEMLFTLTENIDLLQIIEGVIF